MRFLIFLLLSAAAAWAALPVRVTIVTLGAEAPQIAAALKKLEGVEVRQTKGALPEGRKESELTNLDRKALAGEAPALLLLVVSEKGNAFGYVDAATGEELFRIREKTGEELALSAAALVEELRDAEKVEPTPSPQK